MYYSAKEVFLRKGIQKINKPLPLHVKFLNDKNGFKMRNCWFA